MTAGIAGSGPYPALMEADRGLTTHMVYRPRDLAALGVRELPIVDATQADARPAAPGLAFAFELRAPVAAPTELGQVPNGRRRIVDITGGTFEGPGIKGKVRPGGADWQIVRADGFTELDTRYTIETDKGQLVYVQKAGMRHAQPDVM
jgi:hypothetical protein